MADLTSRLVDAAQNAASPEDRAWASSQLMQMKATKDRLMDAAQNAADPADADWARSQLVKLSPAMPTSMSGRMRGPKADACATEAGANADARPDMPLLERSPGWGEAEGVHKNLPHDWAYGPGSPGEKMVQVQEKWDALTPRQKAARYGAAAVAAALGGVGGALLGPALETVAPAAAEAAPSLLARGLMATGRVAGNAAVGAVTGGGAEGTRAAIEGEPVLSAMKEGAKIGGLFGAGAGAAAEAGAGASNAIRSDRWMGRYLRAKDAGAYEGGGMFDKWADKHVGPVDSAMARLPKAEEGIQRAAEEGFRRVAKRDTALAQEASDAYEGTVGPRRGLPVDRDVILGRLGKARDANMDPDQPSLPLNERVDSKLQATEEAIAETPTVRGALARRRALKREAAFDSPSPTPEQQAARDAYHAFRAGVRDASPEVASADDAYTAAARQAARRRQLMSLGEDAVLGETQPLRPPTEIDVADEPIASQPDLSPAKERAAARMLGRVGDRNKPGLEAQKYIQELADQDPRIADAIDFIANKKAQELTRFRLNPVDAPNLSGAMLPKLRMAAQNARALGTEVVDPLARTLALSLEPPTVGVATNPIIRARERERRRANAARTGGAK